MKSKALGVFIATLLALTVVGASYAYWTDQLTITGDVTMGTFYGYLTYDDCGDVEWKEVGKIVCELEDMNYPKLLTITGTNAYPGYEFWVAWDMHWAGSVPAHVTVIDDTLPDWLGIEVTVTGSNHPDIAQGVYTYANFVTAIENSQWHEGYYIDVEYYFTVIEIDCPDTGVTLVGPDQLEHVSFDLIVDFYQYNLDPDPSLTSPS